MGLRISPAESGPFNALHLHLPSPGLDSRVPESMGTSRSRERKEERVPELTHLLLLPRDPAAEGAQAALHSGALVRLLILAHTILAPGQ